MSEQTAGVRYKIPRSALVVIHTPELKVLMMERTNYPGFWQSVTGSVDHEDEPLLQTAAREVREETGIDVNRHRLVDWGIDNHFEIFRRHQSRFAPGVTHNLEHVFGLTVPDGTPVTLDPTEHLRYEWLPWREAAERTISWSNRDAILLLPEKLGVAV
jgi:dATP pyrophosphohydrolase